jgi:TolB-like protein
MSSIIEGYNYDIFISYRQKDNKGEKWVTEFVRALKIELEATFKEDISIYFDENPHDSLLETHIVKKSLQEKLRCLIFIPILSQTYCDTKSYAWQYEFLEFINMASEDRFGSEILLRNGNFASRILPVRIHELDNDDLRLFENETGSPLRSLDFIFLTSTGVNRPLRINEERPSDNLNKTLYRDQINKVANAIKEILLALKTDRSLAGTGISPRQSIVQSDRFFFTAPAEEKHPQLIRMKQIAVPLSIVVLLAISAFMVYQKSLRLTTLQNLKSSDGKISVAVMPFQNLTGDTTWNVWQDGIQDNLTSSLSNVEELRIRQVESIKSLIQSRGLKNYSSLTPSMASSISKRLDASIVVCGSINKSGNIIRLNAQLINSNTEDAIKSFKIDGISGMILHNTDSLAVLLKNYLIISRLNKDITPDIIGRTNSPEAYKYFIYGSQSFRNRDYSTARTMFLHALEIDSDFISAQVYIPWTYGNQYLFKEAKYWCQRVYSNMKRYESSNKLTVLEKITANIMHAEFFETPADENRYLKQYIEIDDQAALHYWMIGNNYFKMSQYDMAIPFLEKSLKIYNEWDSKPYWIYNYTELGTCYHNTSQFDKEKQLYRKAELYFPGDIDLSYREAVLALFEKNWAAANEYLQKYIKAKKENSNEAQIKSGLGDIYAEAGLQDKAEEFYRQAADLQPENPDILCTLASFLIYNNRKLREGLEIIDKAIALNQGSDTDNYNLLHTKGLGLYKIGKSGEAIRIYEKCRNMTDGTYDQGLENDLKEARQDYDLHKKN